MRNAEGYASHAVLYQGRSEIGDAELHRAIRELQRMHFSPPTETEPNPTSTHPGSWHAMCGDQTHVKCYQWRMASMRNPPGGPMTLGNMRRLGVRVTQAVRLAFTRRNQWSLNRPSTTK